MTPKKIEKLINECGNIYETLTPEEITPWNVFVSANNIASKYDDVDCIMNLNFANGEITHGICVITDWKPGALVLQSDDGEAPKLRVVFPEEYYEFMEEIRPVMDAQYPAFPAEQEG